MKEIKLLEEQLLKLDEKGFDFKSWKQYSILLLSRIFGEENQKVRQLSKIEVDYSSWSLRDTSGKVSQIETIKKLVREIIVASIDELKSEGLPSKNQTMISSLPLKILVSALEDDLKVSQFKEIVELIHSQADTASKRIAIENKLNEFGEKVSVRILASILSEEKLRDSI
jgi:hypothetical protein